MSRSFQISKQSPPVRKIFTRPPRVKRQRNHGTNWAAGLTMSGYYNHGGDFSQRHHNPTAYSSDRPPTEGSLEWNASMYQPSDVSSAQYAGQTLSSPAQYVSWPASDLPPIEPFPLSRSQLSPGSATLAPPGPYSTEQWPNAPWPSLHPDDFAFNSDSASTSPDPTDLRHFGILLSDGRSWQCAYEGCTSQIRFTRGCDLRKHFRRHTKSYFCRHPGCPDKDRGFSSNKDRVSLFSSFVCSVLALHERSSGLYTSSLSSFLETHS